MHERHSHPKIIKTTLSVKYSALLCLTTLIATTSALHPFQRIIGANEAQPHEFPYVVSLQQQYIKSHHFCAGTILNENWVLTATHCRLPKNQIRVKAGKHSLGAVEDSEQVVNVSKVIVYRENFQVGDDIALLKLEKPLIFNEFVKPVSLPKKGQEFDGEAIFAGWGYYENKRVSERLRKALIPILDIELCRITDSAISKHPSTISIDRMICTGPLTAEISLCEGDSGGPLAMRKDNESILIGVASFILDRCGSSTSASVYTKVSYYIDWIEDNMAKN